MERNMKNLILPVVLALLLPAMPLHASSFSTTSTVTYKVSRLRLVSTGRAYFGISRSPAATITTDCSPVGSEQYWFDANTLQGRILYNQVLSSYTSQSKVSGSGLGNVAGSCVTNGFLCGVFPSLLFCEVEQLSSFTVQQQ
jgi:hypothetical protein